MSSPTSGNLKLNLLFLVTIFRLDMMSKSTMAKPQEQIVSGQTVLVRDSEPISSTVVYLDESTLSSYSATTIDARMDVANNNYANHQLNNDRGLNQMNGVDNVNSVGNKKTRKDEEAESSADSHQQQPDRPKTGDQVSQLHNGEVTPAFNSTTAAPRRAAPSTIGRPLNREEWLAKEYFNYLCGTFDIRSLIGDHFNGLRSV